MKKYLIVLGLFSSLFLVAFTTKTSNELEQMNPTVLAENLKLGGAYLTFDGKFGGTVNKECIKKTTKLGVDGCASGSLIKEFTLVIKKQKKKSQFFKGKSHLLTDKMKVALQSLNVGDSFDFRNVTAQLPNRGGKIDVTSRRFTVIP